MSADPGRTWRLSPFAAVGLWFVTWLIGTMLGIAALAESRLGYVLVAGVGLVVAAPWLVAAIRRRLDPFEPVYGLSLFWALYYVVGPLWRYAKGESHPFGVSVDDASWNAALVVVGVGLISFLLGYYSRLGATLGGKWRLSTLRFPLELKWIVGGLYVSTVGIRIYAIKSGWYFFAATTREVPAGWTSVLFFFASLAPLLYAYLAVVMLSSTRPRLERRVFLAGIIPIECVFWFLSGYRSAILSVVSIPLIVLWYKTGYFPVKRLVALALILLFIVLPLNTAYRLATIDERGISLDPGSQFVPVLKAAVYTVLENPRILLLGGSELDPQARFIERLEGVSTMAALLERVDPDDFLWGETVLWGVKVFIPNIFWAGKFEAYRARQDEFCDFLNVSFRPCPAVMTQQGELYWNFGVPGVIVGMLVYGVLYRWFYEACAVGASRGQMGLWIYASFWHRLIFLVEGGVIGQSPAFGRQLAGLVGMGLLARIISGAAKQRGR